MQLFLHQLAMLRRFAAFWNVLGHFPSDKHPSLQAWTLRETQTRWQDLKSCRQAKETIDGLNHQRTKEMLRLPRKMLRLIVGVYRTQVPEQRP